MSIDHNRIKVSDLETNQSGKTLITNQLGQLEFTDINNIKIDSYNALDYTDAGKSLDARQGKVLKDLIDNINTLLASDNFNLNTLQKLVDAIEVVQTSLSSLLVNDLTTGGTTKALTAEMGKQLQNNKVDKVVGKNLLSDTEIARLATLSNYTHPANHPPGIILQDLNNRFVTDAEKATWNAKQTALGFVPENVANKNVASGYAGLGADGKLISSQLPSITLNDTFVIATQAAMLALTVQTGDIAVRTDLNKSFILKGSNPTLLADWQELLTPTSAVTTVFGRNGAVVSQTGDYTADQINETSTRKFQSANQQTFNDATSSIQTQLNSKQANITSGTNAQYFRGDKTWQTLDKTAAGLSNVDNTADAAKNVLSATKLTTQRTINGVNFDGSANITINAVDATPRIASSEKGVANGVASLDASGIILTTQLPSYVDDVLEFANLAGFPATGETGKIYVAKDTNKTYRWGGSAYIFITSGAVDSVSGKTGVVTLAKADVGLTNVDNTADLNKPISTATQTALNSKADLLSPLLTGVPTAPTAIAGTNTTQLATTAFVLANNVQTPDATTTLKGKIKLAGDLGGTADLPTTPTAVHKTGNENIDGYKNFCVGGATTSRILINSAGFINGGAGLQIETNNNFQRGMFIDVKDSSMGIYMQSSGTQTAGSPMAQFNNSGAGIGTLFMIGGATATGSALYVSSSGASGSVGLKVANTYGNTGIQIDQASSSTGTPFQLTKASAIVTKIDPLGNITANSFIKTGGTINDTLMADGSTLQLISGSYTPTVTNGTNATNSVLRRATYTRVGNIVTATISVESTPTTANVFGNVVCTLPFNRATSNSAMIGTGISNGTIIHMATVCQTQRYDTVNIIYPTGSLNGTVTSTVTIQYSILD